MTTRNHHLGGSVKAGHDYDQMIVSWSDETHNTDKPAWMTVKVSVGHPIWGGRATASVTLNRAQLEELIYGLTKARKAMDEPTRVVSESEAK